MRVENGVKVLLVLLLGLVMTGCAGLSTMSPTETTCTTKDVNGMLTSGEYQEKVDNFLVIQDTSTSMSDRLSQYFVSYEPQKLVVSKGLMQCLNNTLPENYDANSGLRLFGSVSSADGLIYGMTKYSRDGLGNAVKAVNSTGGTTPLASAISAAAMDLKDMPGNAAVIIFSDGINTGAEDPVAAAAALKDMYGENICIYTVLIDDDPGGKMLMEQVAAAGKCGFATTAENLFARTRYDGAMVGAADGMADFVTSVFLEKAAKPAPMPPPKKVDLDSDGDGVLDSLDKCPNTPKGIKVDSVGCPVPIPEKVSITLLVEFDFDKAAVRPQYHNDIEKVSNFLKAYPDTTAVLEGHTDSVGTDEYNMKLSGRRAESVKKYLVEKFNIDAARISTKAYGESKPVATNETAEGRQRNRRVVATIVTTVMK
jgi:OmpA-OmpF porin, OOP family